MKPSRKFTLGGIAFVVAIALMFGFVPGIAAGSAYWFVPAIASALIAWFGVRNITSEERGATVGGLACLAWFVAVWAMFFVPAWVGIER